MKKNLTFWLGLGLAIFLLVGGFWLQSVTSQTRVDHLMLGNPSNASSDVANVDNYLMTKPEYVLSYSSSKRIPNWVSWQLNSSWLGDADRANNFRPDPDLPKGWFAVRQSDYTGSGYDRGHMTPSADRTKDPDTNSATFLMTNILPQTADNNRKVWERLEAYSRTLVKQGKELYIIAGGAGQKEVIKTGKISIPASTWKIIVVMDKTGLSVSDISDRTRIIAVNVPNEKDLGEDWKPYLTSVDKIEKLTGYDFLSNVSTEIQKAIESKVDK